MKFSKTSLGAIHPIAFLIVFAMAVFTGQTIVQPSPISQKLLVLTIAFSIIIVTLVFEFVRLQVEGGLDL